ncbi:relaxase/mobilization nuclease domain-containing protein [Kaistella yonginensis]|uniref:relaxase/mobilization nuclease domain-containing protein n=1 Tax=Kaistella yonginensis TaxID=658267 RepID=UPI00338DC80B
MMKPAGNSFPAVNYNDKKIKKEKGELTLMKNFPSFIDKDSNKHQVRNYLRAISIGNKKVLKPQFHAMISTKFREHSKEELTKIADNFMNEMGYGKQPFIVVFHADTDNNHVHIVSTRVDKSTRKKINDSFEKLKSQEALNKALEKIYNLKPDEELEKILNYKVSTFSQLEILLERSGFVLIEIKNGENDFDILKNGVKQKTINGNNLKFEKIKNDSRKNQIKAILIKYKELHSNKVFKVEDARKSKSVFGEERANNFQDLKKKIEFDSELQNTMRKQFGIDIVFHHKDHHQPFGYTLIDHKSGKVYKGSEILAMNHLFEFTTETIDKKLFEVLKDYNIHNQEAKTGLLNLLNSKTLNEKLSDFMLFENRNRKDLETYRIIQSEVRDFVKNTKGADERKESISIIKNEDGKFYAVHEQQHFIGELSTLIGEKETHKYADLLKKGNGNSEILEAVDELIFELMKSSGTAKDPAENELKRRKKKRK